VLLLHEERALRRETHRSNRGRAVLLQGTMQRLRADEQTQRAAGVRARRTPAAALCGARSLGEEEVGVADERVAAARLAVGERVAHGPEA
jgi:hypothetical protein